MDDYNMIEIDGSYGEGGGAIVRISAALSALTLNPIHINNIRANRPKTGIMPQHLNAIKAVSSLSNAHVDGLEMRSGEIFFYPESIEGGNYNIDVKTAGSITLVLQAFMIPAGFAKKGVNITTRGGTDVRWSPPIDYLQNVTLETLKSMGYEAKIDLIQRGHYPRGGGIVKVQIKRVKKLNPIKLLDLEIDKIRGISHCAKLPEHVAERQAKSAEETLKSKGYDVDIEIEHSSRALGSGSGIVLWSEGKTRIGASSIGERGKRAEIVGQEAANEFLDFISTGAAFDPYLGDQIIPYMAIAGNSKIKSAELTNHAITNMYVVDKIMGKKFHVDGKLGETANIWID